ncbi:glycosyltransferase family 2 protein [Bacillus sp. FJAT-45066]|uniref:glycosyltransferase family 2 protein n=1 Tax=Bacillus sp. FJAT-45066 TaxID=2011010 RepID=UPI003F8CFD8B
MNSLEKNSEKPLVSVITPSFNSERFIKDTIASVISQTFNNWEMIIVDDGSSDNTIKFVKEVIKHDPRIKLIQLHQNSGPAIARNVALEHAKGRYVAFLDSDDQWLPEKLEKQLNFMQKENVAFSFTGYKMIKEDGSEIGDIIDIPKSVSYDDLLKQNMIGCLTVMIDRDIIGDVKMVNIRTRQDYVLWLNISKNGFKAYGLNSVLAKYRIVNNSISRKKWKMAIQNWKVYREIERMSIWKSSWYFIFYLYYKGKKYMNKSI